MVEFVEFEFAIVFEFVRFKCEEFAKSEFVQFRFASWNLWKLLEFKFAIDKNCFTGICVSME